MDHGATFSYVESSYLSFTLAARRGDLAGVEVLMRDDTVRSVEKDTASGLRAAAAAGKIEVVRFLLRSGVPAGVRDREGRTPLSLARQNGHADVAELLRSYGAEGQDWRPRE
jgi:ankyrin repeat protein